MRMAWAVGALGVALAGAAEAGLEICNETDVLQSIAIGYKGDTDWTSEGWWNIEPGDCTLVVAGDLTKRYYYYFADSAAGTFRGQDYVFCLRDEEFAIVGDTECEARGYEDGDFREVDTGETALDFTLTLVANAPEGTPLTGKGPGGGDMATQSVSELPAEDPVETDRADLQSEMPTGEHGVPFTMNALFQGCELEEGRAYCGFHAGGTKMRAFYGGPTPEDMLLALEEMALNTAVRIEGDRVETRGMQVSVVLRAVEPRQGGDALAELRGKIQGDWISDRDRLSEITIRGSEIYVRYDGEFRAARFLELAETCEGLRGAGPVLIQTSVREPNPACYRVARADERSLDLDPLAGGGPIRFVRAR